MGKPERPFSFEPYMSTKIAVLIDGGHVRVLAKRAAKTFNEHFVEKVGLKCCVAPEQIQRILYYDCAPYTGSVTLPVSGGKHAFVGSDRWLHDLAHKDLFAVRRGVLKFRGWIPKNIPIAARPLSASVSLGLRSRAAE